MKKEMEMLLKLQEIDYQLGELERSKDYLPDMIFNLEKEIEDTNRELVETEEELKNQNLEKKSLELEVDSLNQELNKFQQQMKVIKTNKEYDALTTEIANRKLKISKNEDRILELMDSIDELEEKSTELKKKKEDVDATNTTQLETLRKEMDSVGTKIKMKEDERKNVTVRIEKRLLATYERIKKGRGTDVVVAVKKGACGACYKSLPHQRIQEIKMGNGIIICDSCGRILLWTGE
ncbi:MAG: hypothetical protein AMJ90_08150 [candidate division Zixibacteria bacterium SM23_73_2]|nr:MAG: hypothetical protein AMJ90_08150 [candidate division Zixibacteria bacterium SM23_73_2]